MTGWGRTQEDGQMTSILQNTQVPIISNEECKEKYLNLHDDRYRAGQFGDRVICAGFTDGGQDSCGGDSGGPIMFPHNRNRTYRYFQIGIVSFGHACAHPNIPAIYTNVLKFTDWIDWVLGGMKPIKQKTN